MRRLAAILVLLLLAACAQPQNRIVLLANEDGTPSALTIATAGGTAVLSEPGAAAAIERATSAPQPVTIGEAEIRTVWGDALAYHPQRPVTVLLYFVLDTPNLTPASRSELPRLIELIRQRPAPEVVIVGHTDRSGDQPYNYELGLRRANAVRREVEAIGVPPELITVTSHGGTNPLVPTNRPYEPRNRRVEVTVR
jgi:outer membrane protein OmpA-like peptidoglycan-associated protein